MYSWTCQGAALAFLLALWLLCCSAAHTGSGTLGLLRTFQMSLISTTANNFPSICTVSLFSHCKACTHPACTVSTAGSRGMLQTAYFPQGPRSEVLEQQRSPKRGAGPFCYAAASASASPVQPRQQTCLLLWLRGCEQHLRIKMPRGGLLPAAQRPPRLPLPSGSSVRRDRDSPAVPPNTSCWGTCDLQITLPWM